VHSHKSTEDKNEEHSINEYEKSEDDYSVSSTDIPDGIPPADRAVIRQAIDKNGSDSNTPLSDIDGFAQTTAEGLCRHCGSTVVVKDNVEHLTRQKRQIRATVEAGPCPVCDTVIYDTKNGIKKPTEEPCHRRVKYRSVLQEHNGWPDSDPSNPAFEVVVYDSQGWLKVDGVLLAQQDSGNSGLAIEVINKNPPSDEKMYRLENLGFVPIVVSVSDETISGVDMGAALQRSRKYHPW